MDKAIELALRTWYDKDHSLHLDPLHPAIGLAGEAGELLDLYKKEQFKDGFSWWDCVHCGNSFELHTFTGMDDSPWCKGVANIFTPKILDELGDLWYYLRILAYQSDSDLSGWLLDNYRWIRLTGDELNILSVINKDAAELLAMVEDQNIIPITPLSNVFISFQRIVNTLNCTLDQITELNWTKLRDGDNNGWEKARTSVHR